MAKGDVARGAEQHRLRTVLDLAERIKRTLHNRDEIDQRLKHDLQSTFDNDLSLLRPAHVVDHTGRIEELGCSIWNASIRFDREVQDGIQGPGLQAAGFVVLLRSFAFILLHLSAPVATDNARIKELRLRNCKIGLKAAKYALGLRQSDIALRVLESCSTYVKATSDEDISIIPARDVQNTKPDHRLDDNKYLYAMYLLLRIDHSRVIEHWDMAEHFFNHLRPIEICGDAILGEQAARLFSMSGNDLLSADRRAAATTWFERTLDVLDNPQTLDYCAGNEDLRLSATARLISTLLQDADANSLERAWRLADELDSLYGLGERINTNVMQVDVLLAIAPIRKDTLKQTMQQLIQHPLDEQIFALIMRAIHKVRKHDHAISEYTLRNLIMKRILSNIDTIQPRPDYTKWLENSLVTYVFLLLAHEDQESSKQSSTKLSAMLDAIWAKINQPLLTKVVHAVQTLIWKRLIEVDASTAAPWLAPLQHALLSNSGDQNKVCISRKSMQILIEIKEFTEARATFFRMPGSAQDQPLSRYLAFKIALHQSDQDWAIHSLKMIASSEDSSLSLLHACAIEAQSNTNRALTMLTLTTIAEIVSDVSIDPALLRCLARLQVNEVEAQSSDLTSSVGNAIATFERCADCIDRNLWSTAQADLEILWWSKTAYNLALRWSELADTDSVVRLLKVAIRLLKYHKHNVDSNEAEERLLVAYFLIATALIVQARGSDEQSESMLQSYLGARHHIKAYLDIWSSTRASTSISQLCSERAFELHRYDLEAICRLRQWSELDQALRSSLSFPDLSHWQKLADIVLIIHKELGSSTTSEQSTHTPQILDILQHIVNDTWRRDKNVMRAARWVRVAFSIDTAAMDRQRSNGSVAFKLLSQAADIAKRGQDGAGARFPDDELQWLASVSFNRGIDCCITGERDMAWKWFDAALELAQHANDNGTLHACLRARQGEAERYLEQHHH